MRTRRRRDGASRTARCHSGARAISEGARESDNARTVVMDSGRAAARRPGMTAMTTLIRGRLPKSATFRDHALGRGAVPWDHFSILPSTPQAVRPRKIGRAKPLRPMAGVSAPSRGPSAAVSETFVSNRRAHGAEQAERGLLAVEQIADGLAERAVDLAERQRLAVGAGGEEGLEQVERLAELRRLRRGNRRDAGHAAGHAAEHASKRTSRHALALQLLDQRHDPLQQGGDVVRPTHGAKHGAGR